MANPRAPKLIAAAFLALGLTGCLRGCTSSRPPIHINPNMDYQPRVDAQEESGFFCDGQSMRKPVPGTIAIGELIEEPRIHTGQDAEGAFLASSPLPLSDELLARGENRYMIYCSPCHEKRGTGRGIMFQYGSVPTPSFHEQRIVDMPDGEIFDTITFGKNLMKGYGYPVQPRDRWAIISHLRRLQRERQQRQLALAGGAP